MKATLEDLKRHCKIDWTTVLAGWRGFGNLHRLVTIPEVRNFAAEKLGAASRLDPDLPDLAELATASEESADEVDRRLTSLASREKVGLEAAVRRWVVPLLEDKLRELPSDPLYGLLGLTEFWSDVGFPDYSPHQAQGQGNSLGPLDYYTEENYSKTLEQHKKWIDRETCDVRGEGEAGG